MSRLAVVIAWMISLLLTFAAGWLTREPPTSPSRSGAEAMAARSGPGVAHARLSGGPARAPDTRSDEARPMVDLSEPAATLDPTAPPLDGVAEQADERVIENDSLLLRLADHLHTGELGCVEGLALLRAVIWEDTDTEYGWLFNSRLEDAPLRAEWTIFAYENPDLVVGLLDTVCSRLEAAVETGDLGLDPYAIEFVANRLGLFLPLSVDPSELDRLRKRMYPVIGLQAPGLAEAGGFLSTLLHAWATRVGPMEAARRVREGDYGTLGEAIELMARMTPSDLSDEQIAPVLVATLQDGTGDSRAFEVGVSSLVLGPGTVAAVDDAWLETLTSRELPAAARKPLLLYLSRTERRGWHAARTFLERALAAGGHAATNAAALLPSLRPPPPEEFVERVLREHCLPDRVAASLRDMLD